MKNVNEATPAELRDELLAMHRQLHKIEQRLDQLAEDETQRHGIEAAFDGILCDLVPMIAAANEAAA